MKFAGAAAAALCMLAALQPAAAETESPVVKALELISSLQAKVLKEGEDTQKVFGEYSEWCEERSKNLGFEIKTGQAEVEGLKAAISEEVATSQALTTKIEELASSIAGDEADLKAATEIRGKEAADFASVEKELTEAIAMLERATAILEREMAKGGASMLQLQNAGSLVQALGMLVQASEISSADAAKLTAFVQSSADSGDEDADADVGAPAGAVYQGHSGDIVQVLQGLLDKAGAQLADGRNKEAAALHNFEMLKQSLEDEIKFAGKDLDGAKKGVASSGEARATAEGDLEAASKELAADDETKGSLHHSCLTRAQDFEAEAKSRGEELQALAEAKKVLQEATGGAEAISYGLSQQASLLQTSRSSIASGLDLANFEAVRFVRDLARRQSSPELAQLAKGMASVMRMGGGSSSDPFAKVKALITDMVAKLEKEAGADATKKAYCDKELSGTDMKKIEKGAEIDKLSTRIDQMSARSVQLKQEVSELQNALAKLAAAQAEMELLRRKEHDAFASNKAEMEQGLAGVQAALQILSEYYSSDAKAHAAATGTGKTIIGLLEVVESDFTKGLAEMGATEEVAQVAFERESKENEIERVAKDKDVEYKNKEAVYLDKTAAELSSDRMGVQAELDAVLEYLARIQEQCIAKPEAYEVTKARREAEVAGLKQALQILESETALLQQKALRHRALRGRVTQRHLAAVA